ncbi:unnamed protein product [marine sediment metagenome]|uniref:Uncharacterized protein n=1 Tax=marine sediment metagenome TaxID=412755 RepID=X0ZL37_9ZZZZ
MELKHKVLGFIPTSNLFVGIEKETNTIGIVTFGDNCKYDAEARQRTDDTIENDKSYKVLREMSKDKTFDERDI